MSDTSLSTRVTVDEDNTTDLLEVLVDGPIITVTSPREIEIVEVGIQGPPGTSGTGFGAFNIIDGGNASGEGTLIIDGGGA